jgi:hypothetical protein
MKDNATRQNRNWLNVVLGGVLLLASAGCTSVIIYMGSPEQGGPSSGHPAGGDFVPVQALLAGGGQVTVCGQPVSGNYVRFYPPTQIPPTGYTGFRGALWNVTANSSIPNTDYYLQFFVTSQNNGCCAIVGGSSTDVSCPVTAGLTYRFTAHFKTGHVPAGNPTIQLSGAWTP